jgi:DNA-binding MarR family transcriptional regulator
MTKNVNKPSPEVLAATAGCACLSLRMAARAVTQMYDHVLKPTALKATQFSVLATVAYAGPASMTTVSQTLVMDRTTLTRNLKPLLQRGLVAATTGGDKRQRTITVTPKGEAVLADALPLWKKAHGQIVDGVGAARWQGLAKLLQETIRLSQ